MESTLHAETTYIIHFNKTGYLTSFVDASYVNGIQEAAIAA